MSQRIPTPPSSDDQSAYREVVGMLTGHWTVQSIYVFSKLGVADRLGDTALDADELARILGVHAPSLLRLLRGLVAVGVLREDAAGRFETTALGRLLRSDAPSSLRDLAIMSGEEQYAGWGRLLDGVRSGRPAFEVAHGRGLFEYLGRTPAAASTFDGAMAGLARALGESLAEQLDLSGFTEVVDVGGGRGVFLERLLDRYQHLRGIVFDLPHVAAKTSRFITEHALADRCIAVGGDFFQDLPEGSDAYVLCQVLFNWDDRRAQLLLDACRRVVPSRGMVVVVENMLGPHGSPFSSLMDLQMMAMPGGRVRTVEEYERRLMGSGFRVSQRLSLAPLGTTALVGRPV